jgi:hypothetical protein
MIKQPLPIYQPSTMTSEETGRNGLRVSLNTLGKTHIHGMGAATKALSQVLSRIQVSIREQWYLPSSNQS